MASAFGVGAANMFGAGQNNAGNNNPFSLQPFGGTSPFSQQTGTSFFGNTSTGNFGKTTPFGGTSSPGVGSSTPNFGGSNVCGQKPAFGGFGSNTQTNPSFSFGSTSTFGNTTFGTTSSPFGTPRSPFAQVTTSTVGSGGFGQPRGSRVARYSYTSYEENGTNTKLQSISAMNVYKDKIHEELRWEDYQRGDKGGHTTAGTSFAPSMGQSNSFTSSTPFIQTTPNLFASNSTTNPSTAQSNPFSSFSSTLFGQTTSNLFSANSTTNPFRSSFSTLVGQTAPNLFSANSTTNPSTAQSSPFSSTSMTFTQTTPSAFSANVFASPSTAQSNPFNSSTSSTHSPFSTNALTFPSIAQSNPFNSSTSLTHSPFSTNATTNPSTSQSNPFSSSTPTTFVQTTPNPFSANVTTNPFTSQSNPFSSSTSTTFIQTTPNPFSPNATTNPSASHSNSFSSTTLTTSQTPNIFSPNATTFPSTGKSNQTGSSPWGQNGLFTSSSLNSFTASNLAQTPASASAPFLQTVPVQTSTGINFSNLGSSQSNLFQPTLPPQTNNDFNSCNSGPNQSDGSGSGNGLNSIGQNVGQLSSNQKTAVAQPVAVRNPFGTLPAMPHMSISNAGTSSSVQYGISSMPVVDKPTPVRISPLLTSRLLSQHRLRLPVTKYHPKHNGSRVAFFSDENEVPRTPNSDALLSPRENPRALVVQPLEHWHPNSCTKEASMVIHEIDGATKSRSGEEQCNLDRRSQKHGGFSDDSMNHKEDSNISISVHRVGEPATVYEETTEIEAMMPKLRHLEYYTEPHIQELATKERGEPGFCIHVNNFVVGRHGYGSIKFLGDTDVRHLDLDSIVQFNNREVNVYMDERKKPSVGEGLNKPAEVTLLNIKCYDKKTGNQILEGPRIEKYKEMLKKKSEDQGAEFLSYDPVKGEWKFRVSHF